MAAGFRIRRVKSESSIGDKLKRARIRRKIGISQIEEETKIRSKFLLALEGDSWDLIPSEVYGRGYLETYSQYLRLDTDAIMKQYAREREMYSRRCQDNTVELAPKTSIKLPRFLLTPRFFVIGMAVVVMLVFSGAIGYQIKRFTSAPFLELASPVQAAAGDGNELVVHADSFKVSGRTAIGASIQVNSEPVEVDDQGNFSHSVEVVKGTNAIVVEALNNQGKKTSEVLQVVVK